MVRTDAVIPMMPAREAMPTLPCDLTEYARRETGPRSWSAFAEEDGDAGALELDDPFDTLIDDEDWNA